MLKKLIKPFILKFRSIKQKRVNTEIAELLWANIYHDTSKGYKWTQNISIIPYGMAINYSMLYLLLRILSEYKIKTILEFGLGQSSKFINAYLESENHELIHHIIEHDHEWSDYFLKNITNKSELKILKIGKIQHEFVPVQVYEKIAQSVNAKYDLYLIDGPVGLPNFSRFDVCILAENLNSDDQFIIIMDDYQRRGEQETIGKLKDILTSRKIKFNCKEFIGAKTQFLLFTDDFKNISYF